MAESPEPGAPPEEPPPASPEPPVDEEPAPGIAEPALAPAAVAQAEERSEPSPNKPAVASEPLTAAVSELRVRTGRQPEEADGHDLHPTDGRVDEDAL